MSIDDLKIYTGGSRGLLGTSIYCISYPGIDLTADVVWKAFFFTVLLDLKSIIIYFAYRQQKKKENK